MFIGCAGMSVKKAVSAFLLAVAGVVGFAGCNGQDTPGRLEAVQPVTKAKYVGTVYLIRGWMGVYSKGMDDMAAEINKRGGTALVYQDQQYKELTKTLIEKYKGVPNHEPILFVGHSRGVDAEIIISRELGYAGIKVDTIFALDSVDQTQVPGNVRICYNYWMPGVLGGNLLRGIPLEKEPGSSTIVHNYNLDTEYRSWRQDATDHISLDDDPWIQKRIIDHVFEVCVERSRWEAHLRAAPR